MNTWLKILIKALLFVQKLLFYSFFIFISISLVRTKNNWKEIIGVDRIIYTPVVNEQLATKRVSYVHHWPRTTHHQ